ncbi:MAG: putative DNA modification/repair radical SAM protein [Bacteroidales bacterium]|jgi:putative DNA modification/repair radical SAM protein|nr:putative DNA modification/repair radical SAM protein [Bacteroidales bacterium]
MNDKTLNKLHILADSAKYDVSCSSSGSNRPNDGKGLGNAAPMGICHSFSEDGRCISLLKVLLTNVCIYDCAYCINRRSNDIRRATLKVTELVELTINFYRRNYIEGLFLSSGVIRNPDYTMEALLRVAKSLRQEHRFGGYIHLKAIPGASPGLVHEAGLYADRMSVNIEIPSENNLKLLAPEKNFPSVYHPMNQIKESIIDHKEARRKFRKAPHFVPAGQSTQLIIGATSDNDKQILTLASGFYNDQHLKRVYYSGFIPVNASDERLPMLKQAPLLREHRLYQADWLMRFYEFQCNEIVNDEHPQLDTDIDPKLAYALRHPYLFPIDLNTADYEMILRVPGIGVRSAKLIVHNRRFGHITLAHLKKMRVALNRAKFFITTKELPSQLAGLSPSLIRRKLHVPEQVQQQYVQLSLF